jgi:two-component system nitrogen regulation response regulator GlnG
VDEISECFKASAGDIDAMAAQLQVSKRALQRRLRELGLLSRTRVGRPGAEPEDQD